MVKSDGDDDYDFPDGYKPKKDDAKIKDDGYDFPDGYEPKKDDAEIDDPIYAEVDDPIYAEVDDPIYAEVDDPVYEEPVRQSSPVYERASSKPADFEEPTSATEVLLKGGPKAKFFLGSKATFCCAKFDEEYGKISNGTVEFRVDKSNKSFNLKDIIGYPFNFDIPSNKSDDRFGRKFSGYCVSAEYLGTISGNDYFTAEVRSWIWFLTKKKNSQIFAKMDVIDIFKDIIKEYSIFSHDLKLIKDDKTILEKRDLCVQYRETDFDFVSRLLEQEGLYYYFEHDEKGGKQIIIADGCPKSTTDIKYHPAKGGKQRSNGEFNLRAPGEGIGSVGEDTIFAFQDSNSVVSGSFELDEWSYQNPSKRTSNLHVKKENQWHPNKKLTEELNQYDYPGNYIHDVNKSKKPKDIADVGERFAQIRVDAEGARSERWRAFSNTSLMQLGSVFKLSKDAKGRGKKGDELHVVKLSYYVVSDIDAHFPLEGRKIKSLLDNVEIDHGKYSSISDHLNLLNIDDTYEMMNDIPSLAGLSYFCVFEAIPNKVRFKAPQTTHWPEIPGVQTALVIGDESGKEEIFTDTQGRIKIKFHWDRQLRERKESKTCFVRVMTPWSGDGFGMMHIPRVGQEVVVQFEEGNPDRPIVVGMLYNKEKLTPPFQKDIAKNKTQSGIRTKSSPKGNAKTYSELVFDDEKGKEFVFFQSERDYIHTVKNDALIEIGLEHKDKGTLTTTVQDNIIETTLSGDHTTIVKDGMQAITVKKDQIVGIGGEQIEKIAKDQSLEVGKGQKVEISKDQDIKIGGDMTIKISKGKGLIDAKKEFKIKVGSSTITIKPTGIELKAAKITLNAKTKVDVKASAVTIDAKAKVDIKAKAAINVDAKGQTKVAGAMVEVAGKGMVTIKGGVIMAN